MSDWLTEWVGDKWSDDEGWQRVVHGGRRGSAVQWACGIFGVLVRNNTKLQSGGCDWPALCFAETRELTRHGFSRTKTRGITPVCDDHTSVATVSGDGIGGSSAVHKAFAIQNVKRIILGSLTIVINNK